MRHLAMLGLIACSASQARAQAFAPDMKENREIVAAPDWDFGGTARTPRTSMKVDVSTSRAAKRIPISVIAWPGSTQLYVISASSYQMLPIAKAQSLTCSVGSTFPHTTLKTNGTGKTHPLPLMQHNFIVRYKGRLYVRQHSVGKKPHLVNFTSQYDFFCPG